LPCGNKQVCSAPQPCKALLGQAPVMEAWNYQGLPFTEKLWGSPGGKNGNGECTQKLGMAFLAGECGIINRPEARATLCR